MKQVSGWQFKKGEVQTQMEWISQWWGGGGGGCGLWFRTQANWASQRYHGRFFGKKWFVKVSYYPYYHSCEWSNGRMSRLQIWTHVCSFARILNHKTCRSVWALSYYSCHVSMTSLEPLKCCGELVRPLASCMVSTSQLLCTPAGAVVTQLEGKVVLYQILTKFNQNPSNYLEDWTCLRIDGETDRQTKPLHFMHRG
jgi:hypothetical protein